MTNRQISRRVEFRDNMIKRGRGDDQGTGTGDDWHSE